MPPTEFSIRLATPADIPTIAAHRRAMFADMEVGTNGTLDQIEAAFIPWAQAKMAQQLYWHWLVEDAAAHIWAGGGLWLWEWPAHPIDLTQRRAYLLNVYVHPDQRRKGLAEWVVQTMLAWCRAQGLVTVTLHASDMGRPLYEKLGFKASNEMRLHLE